MESVSVEICNVMTRLGYGEEMRRWRVKKYREMDRVFNAGHSDVTLITVGSKAEGLTRHLESDRDYLIVLNDVLCVEECINIQPIPKEIDVFRMDTRVYPGHCRLLQARTAHNRMIEIRNSLCDNGYGNVLLSSSLLLDEVLLLDDGYTDLDSLVVNYERAGPSLPQSFSGLLHVDRVPSLRCDCPSILEEWADRPRQWPSPAIVQKVVSLGAFVTPVGFKGSEYKHMEWRICFNTGESELVHNLNDTQAKVYVILKMILKDILKPKNKEITSYVLKNIILWQAENTSQAEFRARNLLYWLHDGLRELRTTIQEKSMRFYMIPKRNLMEACGMEDALKHKMVADITDMLEEGPRVILRLEKIRKAIIAHPQPMLWFSKTRMELEMLSLERFYTVGQCMDENGVVDDSDCIMNAISRRMYETLIELLQRMRREGSSLYYISYIFN